MFWINMILGLLLIIAPFVFGYNNHTAALWSSVILGAIIALASGYKAFAKDEAHWEDWVDVVAGIVAVIVPFLFGFGTLAAAMWTSVVLGVFVAAIAGYQLYAARQTA